MKVKLDQVHRWEIEILLSLSQITINMTLKKIFLGGGSMSICLSICSSDFPIWQTTFLKRNIRGSYLAWSCLWLCLWSSSLTKVKVIPSPIWHLRGPIRKILVLLHSFSSNYALQVMVCINCMHFINKFDFFFKILNCKAKCVHILAP